MTVSLRCGCAFFLEKLAIIKCRLSLPESVARHLYLCYDLEKEFLPQFRENAENLLYGLQMILSHNTK